MRFLKFFSFKTLFLCCLVGFGYFVYKRTPLKQYTTAFFSCITYPLLRFYNTVDTSIERSISLFKKQDELIQTIACLKQEKEELQKEVIRITSTTLYAQDTHEIRAFNQRYAAQGGIVAQVLKKTLHAYEHSFLVNAGSVHGITLNMVALVHNSLVGKVVTVYPWYCKVSLITDSECKVSGACAQTGAIGIHQGSNNTSLSLLCHVNHLERVIPGDLVVSTGKGLIFPQGFGLGRIATCNASGLEYDITVKPLFDPQTVNYCVLIAKQQCEKH